MAKKVEFELPADIPVWLMTFSDVITLLMTFFILLLTFATNQPETFERMQVAMFAGGGATGIAGPSQKPLDQDSILLRMRPRSGRITMRGAEMPPVNSDPVLQSLAKGLQGLEEEERRDLATSHAASIPLSLLVDESNGVTAMGKQQLKMLARHVRRKPFNVELLVSNAADLERAHVLAWSLHQRDMVEIKKISVGRRTQPGAAEKQSMVMFVLSRPLEGVGRGEKN